MTNTGQRRLHYGRFGLTEDPRGFQVTMPYQGRTLLGDVIDMHWDEVRGGVRLHVRHFNGEDWPCQPFASAVSVLRGARP
jgi:hypothetical protein